MKNFFFIFLLILFSLFNRVVMSDDNTKIQKIFEGHNLPAHLSKNDFISPDSIFVLEHKLGKIIEIQNYIKNPKLNSKPILNINPLIT